MDDQGNPVLNINGNQMMMPSDADPHFLIDQGLGALSAVDDGGTAYANLAAFRIGGPWDLQHVGPNGLFVGAFTDFSNVAIGLYSAAAGIPEGATLTIANEQAAMFSTFSPNAVMDSTYTYLRAVNVWDIRLGYQLYQQGRIGPSP